MTPREHLEQKALDVGLIMVPEFQFDHVFYALNQENLLNDPATQMAEIYSRCSEFLRLNTRPNVGITVIVSPRWFFLCILTQPYCSSPSGNPVYLDGFDFAGLVSLQLIDETWPATAGLENQQISISQAIAASTKVVSVFDESTMIGLPQEL